MHGAIRELIKSGFSMTDSGEGVKCRRVSFFYNNVGYQFRQVDRLTLECVLNEAVVVTYRHNGKAIGDSTITNSTVEINKLDLGVEINDKDDRPLYKFANSLVMHHDLDNVMLGLRKLMDIGTELINEMRKHFHLLEHPKEFSGKGSFFTGVLNGKFGDYECLLTTGEISLIKNDLQTRVSQLMKKEKTSRVVAHMNSLILIVEGFERHVKKLPLSQMHEAAAMILAGQLNYKKCY